MKLIQKDGFNYKFNPKACESCEGNCCIGESGYIWVNDEEIENIAKFLDMSIEKFKKECLIKVGNRFSIKERKYKNGFACIFFNKGCIIYPVRPNQCRTFPFWNYFKNNIEELLKECPGVVIDD
jgi:Fe-S-cluster containining protein